ncbi:MAG: hypothetical protein ACRDHF_00515 [Tepidiformaceae bacterium]
MTTMAGRRDTAALPEFLARCFRAQARFPGLPMRDAPQPHEMCDFLARTWADYGPNMLLWTGSHHQLAITLKDDLTNLDADVES